MSDQQQPGAPERPTRRFVAGASCPSCRALDTLAMDVDPQGDRITCVDCGHEEWRPTRSADAADERDNVVALRIKGPFRD